MLFAFLGAMFLTSCTFGPPLVTFRFGPLVTINVGARHEKQEINAFGQDVARQVIADSTKAMVIEIPSKDEWKSPMIPLSKEQPKTVKELLQ